MSEKRIYKGLVLNDYGEGKNYATYVKEGTKLIETRMNRLFSFRGDVVICCGAGKSVTPNAGKALCIVEVWKGREMLPTDVEAARIEWHPKRKSHLLRNWRYFSENFEFAPMAIQKNFQGMFDMAIPDHVEIIPRPDIIPFDEPEEQTQPTLFESKPPNDMSQKREVGYLTSEICNRNGCQGVIEETKKEGSCSCHINPPCSYCVDDNHYCPVCGWEGKEEQKAPTASAEQIERYQKEYEKRKAEHDSFYRKYAGQEPIEKLEMMYESHTHFSQKVFGVFPKGTETRESVIPKVKGTFGGRFERFTETSFEYIAYTD